MVEPGDVPSPKEGVGPRPPRSQSVDTFDAIVIGTGFAGAVTACRLAEAGFDICVLERGRRYGPDDFPRYPEKDLFSRSGGDDQFAPPPDFSRWSWSIDRGLFDVKDLDEVVSVQAAGYGGGSLIYANVHLRPPRDLFQTGWPQEYYADDQGEWTLAPYYDLAAYMLRVSPIPSRLEKTVRLREAAAAQPGSWFRPPLAVNFDNNGPNAFGRAQQSCDMRGRCILGCDRQAKNTLDLNYLARVEDAPPGRLGRVPDIRTMAEVTRIQRRRRDGKRRFTVTYKEAVFREHAAGKTRRRKIHAEYVFVCAGAVNTTELLMRSAAALGLTERERIGAHYFPNADTLGVVFDSAKPHEADYGPTITSALLYDRPESDAVRQLDQRGRVTHTLDFSCGRTTTDTVPLPGVDVFGHASGARARLAHRPILDWGKWALEPGAFGQLALTDVTGDFQVGERLSIGETAHAEVRSYAAERRHWFLVEDGGYPPELEPLLGIFRSPLWARRNRFREERDEHVVAAQPHQLFSSSQPAAVTPYPPASAPRRTAGPHLRVAAFANALRGVPPATVLGRPTDKGKAAAIDLLDNDIAKLLPQWFTDAIRRDHREILDQVAAMALPLLGRFLDTFAETTTKQWTGSLPSRLNADVVSTTGKQQVLVRGLLRQALQILAGSEAALARRVAQMLVEPVPDTPSGLLNLFGDAVLWALAYRVPSVHAGLLLVMGRDLYRGRLEFSDAPRGNSILAARMPPSALDTGAQVQERVLRHIAKTWQGELRTNPAWAPLGTRVTVHSQGGCPMGEKGLSVTSSTGEVHGCEGLYVMDAAAFPTSVGVNPSATIAAIAEYKVESFIHRAHQRPDWQGADDIKAAQQWMATRRAAMEAARQWMATRRAALDPLNSAKPPTSVPQPESEVLGLTFCEQMRGFMVPVSRATNWDHLETFQRRVRRFVEAEHLAMSDGLRVNAKLTARIDDLSRLLSREPGPAPIRIALTGPLTIESAPGVTPPLKETGEVSGSLEMFVRATRHTTPGVRFFRYELRAIDPALGWHVNGVKMLSNDPGMDAWQDASTIFFELEGFQRIRHRGIMRVSLQDFLNEQIQSLDVTGTSDTARKSWALAAFYKYFASELAQVYSSPVNRMVRLFAQAAMGIHV